MKQMVRNRCCRREKFFQGGESQRCCSFFIQDGERRQMVRNMFCRGRVSDAVVSSSRMERGGRWSGTCSVEGEAAAL